MAFDTERLWAFRMLIISLSIGMVLYMVGLTSESPAIQKPHLTDSNSSIGSGSPGSQPPTAEGADLIDQMRNGELSILYKIPFWTDFVWTNIFGWPWQYNVFLVINTLIVGIASLALLGNVVSALRGFLGG